VRINGLEITALEESKLPMVRRSYVGFVFQTFNLLEALNARENVEVALNLAGVKGREARDRSEQLLTDLEMDKRLRFRPRALSGGEKQRVSIARALANDPKLILADEPTANLDSKHGHEAVVLLRDIAKKQGRTVVIVSHDHRIREVAHRVLWLEDGRFRADVITVRDAVCGQLIEVEGAPTVSFNGMSYYFCAEQCLKLFEAAPRRYVEANEG
jgi:putative ABC transport system ATP-binding protein